MSKPYKLLVVDVDGTLVDRHGNISARDKQALAEVRARGIQVSLSTGRIIQSCLKILDQLELDGYHIFFDGALVSDPHLDKEVYARPLKKELVREAVDFSRDNGIFLELYSAQGFFIEQDHWSIEIHRNFFGVEPAMVDFDSVWDKERIIKAELVVSSSPEELAIADTFQRRFNDSLRFSWAMTPAYPNVHFVNVVDPAVSKGKALEVLAGFLGIPLSETMVVGDGSNDLPLLETAGLAVAMGNARDEVKAVADHVTLDIEHSGLAAAIERFLS